jgi:hypothetical protein
MGRITHAAAKDYNVSSCPMKITTRDPSRASAATAPKSLQTFATTNAMRAIFQIRRISFRRRRL